jgi:hypothetical protein
MSVQSVIFQKKRVIPSRADGEGPRTRSIASAKSQAYSVNGCVLFAGRLKLQLRGPSSRDGGTRDDIVLTHEL